jgi:hypothetical protein
MWTVNRKARQMAKIDSRVERQNEDGSWGIAIPLPMFRERWWQPKFRCECGAKFKNRKAYEDHYRAAVQDSVIRGGGDTNE